MTRKDERATPHANEKRMNEIEHKHEARCMWQQVLPSRTIMVECLYFPRVKSVLLVTKHFNRPIPRSGSGKPWPEMMGCYVYAPIGGNTWDGLEKAIDDLIPVEAAEKIKKELSSDNKAMSAALFGK